MSAIPTVRIVNPFGEGWIIVNADEVLPGQRFYVKPGPATAGTPPADTAPAPVPDPAPLDVVPETDGGAIAGTPVPSSSVSLVDTPEQAQTISGLEPGDDITASAGPDAAGQVARAPMKKPPVKKPRVRPRKSR